MYISDICSSVGRNEWEKGKEGGIDGPMSENEGGREGWMEEGKGVAFVPRPLKRALYPLFAHAQAPHFLCGIGNFRKIDSVTLTPVASFPGLPWLWILIASSMQKLSQKAW